MEPTEKAGSILLSYESVSVFRRAIAALDGDIQFLAEQIRRPCRRNGECANLNCGIRINCAGICPRAAAIHNSDFISHGCHAVAAIGIPINLHLILPRGRRIPVYILRSSVNIVTAEIISVQISAGCRAVVAIIACLIIWVGYP